MNQDTSEQGFTIIEVIIALVVFSVGALAVVGTSGLVTRMLGQGRRSTQAGVYASGRMESLRQIANSTTPRCTALGGGSSTHTGRYTEAWTVTGTGSSRTATIIVTYPTARLLTADTVITVIGCN